MSRQPSNHRHSGHQTNLFCNEPSSSSHDHTITCLLDDLHGHGCEDRVKPPPFLAALRSQMYDYFTLALENPRMEVTPPTQCLYMLSQGYYTEQELRGYPGFAQCMRAVAQAEARRRARARLRRGGGGRFRRNGATRVRAGRSEGRFAANRGNGSSEEDEESEGESVLSMDTLTSDGYDDDGWEDDGQRGRGSRKSVL